ncbi:MAG: hypothetical protein KDE14_07390 [Rhodobacteraceae bacterium]|nr:hypothetical protein [Paracoccaceae bacterium]
MMAAQAVGIDPYLAAEAGDDAKNALTLLRKARAAKDRATRAELIRDAQNELKYVDANKHPELFAAIDLRLRALEPKSRSTNPRTGVQEFAFWDRLTSLFSGRSDAQPPNSAIDPISIQGHRFNENLKPAIAPISVTANPVKETLRFGKAPVLGRMAERQRAIQQGEPATFIVNKNSNADGSRPPYSIDWYGSRVVNRHHDAIERIAAEKGIDPNLIRSIMFVENAQGNYGGLSPITDRLGISETVLPMNINPKTWRDLGLPDRRSALDDAKNIAAGTELIKRIQDRVAGPQIEKTATLYNNLFADSINDYGARVARVYQSRPWE